MIIHNDHDMTRDDEVTAILERYHPGLIVGTLRYGSYGAYKLGPLMNGMRWELAAEMPYGQKGDARWRAALLLADLAENGAPVVGVTAPLRENDAGIQVENRVGYADRLRDWHARQLSASMDHERAVIVLAREIVNTL